MRAKLINEGIEDILKGKSDLIGKLYWKPERGLPEIIQIIESEGDWKITESHFPVKTICYVETWSNYHSDIRNNKPNILIVPDTPPIHGEVIAHFKNRGFEPLIKDEFLKFLKEQEKYLKDNLNAIKKLKSII